MIKMYFGEIKYKSGRCNRCLLFLNEERLTKKEIGS